MKRGALLAPLGRFLVIVTATEFRKADPIDASRCIWRNRKQLNIYEATRIIKTNEGPTLLAFLHVLAFPKAPSTWDTIVKSGRPPTPFDAGRGGAITL